jgi:signal transduction histidine kinase
LSLATRIVTSVLVPMLLCIGVFGVINVRLRRVEMIDDARRELRDHATTLSASLGAALRDHQIEDVAELVDDLSRADRVLGVVIFDHDDQLVRASRSLQREAPRFATFGRRARAETDRVEAMTASDGRRVIAYGFALRARVGERHRGSAVLLRDLSYVDENVAHSARTVSIVGVLLALIVVAAAWIGVRSAVLRPVELLVAAVERTGLDALEHKAPVLRRDEVGRLSRAYNALLDSLREARAALDERTDALVAAERRLHHAQRLALVGQLAANLAHRMGSPLNVILGRARYALQQGGQSERDQKHLREIVAGAESISAVIEQLLSRARRGRGKVSSLELGSIALDVARFLEVEAEERGITIAIAAAGPAWVKATRNEIEQVVLNLCVNAMQAQPRGGRVELSVRELTEEPPRVELRVDDAGPGVAPSERERVFEAFYTSKEPHEGTGLGLTICEEIAQALGGTLTVTDSALGGAAFIVVIPRDTTAGPRPAPSLDQHSRSQEPS